MKDNLFSLVTLLRALNIHYQVSHHNTKGVTFFGDHEFLGGAYEEVVGDYDSLAERFVCEFGDEDISKLIDGISTYNKYVNKNNIFKSFSLFEKEVQDQIEKIAKEKISQGLYNLLGSIAEKSESRYYKIEQRIK